MDDAKKANVPESLWELPNPFLREDGTMVRTPAE